MRNLLELYRNTIQGVSQRIISGSFWVLAGTMLSKMLVFIATIVVARILTKEVYGQLGIIRSTIQLFVSFSAFGIGATATKHIAQYRNSDPRLAVKIYCIANIFVLVMGAFASTILIGFADVIASTKLNAPELASDIRIAGIILFFTLINGAQTGTLSGFEDFKRIAITNLVMGLSEIILLILGAKYFGLTGAILGFGFTYFIAWGVNTYFIRRHLSGLRISVSETLKGLRLADFRIIYSFSLPVAVSSWIIMGTYWWVKTMVVHDAGFSNMANYDVAEQWRTQLLFIPGIVANVMLPVLSNTVNNMHDTKTAIKINLAINVGITSILFLGICLFGNMILSLYGAEYANPIPLYVLTFAAIVESVSNLCGTVVISSGQASRVLIFNAMWAVSLVFVYTYIVHFDSNLENCLAFAYLFAAIVQLILMGCFVLKYLKKHVG